MIVRGNRLVLLGLALMMSLQSGLLYAEEMQVSYIRDVIKSTGVSHWVEDTVKILHSGIKHRKQERGGGEPLYLRANQAVDKYFVVDEIITDMALAMADEYDARRYLMLRRLSNTLPYRQLRELREAARSDVALQEIKLLADGHKDKPIPKERTELIKQLDEVSGETEFFIAIQALNIATLLQMFESNPQPYNISLVSAAQQLEVPSRFTSGMTLRYAYRDTSDEELKQFIAIYENSVMTWFHSKALEVLVEVINQRASKARLVVQEK